MISVENVSKFFGSVKALENVSFEIKSGEVVGFLGPNGAGKTTMMRLVTGIFPPTEGKILINGKNLFKSKAAIRAQIGYLAEHNPLYRDMTAKEFLFYAAALKGVGFWSRKREVESIMDQCDLGAVRNRLIGKLSKGYQQRVGLAQALIGSPHFLILDEPTNGLDPKQISDMRNLIRTLAQNRTILLSTHMLSEVEAVCQRVLILNEGCLAANFELSELKRTQRSLEDIFLKVVAREEAYV